MPVTSIDNKTRQNVMRCLLSFCDSIPPSRGNIHFDKSHTSEFISANGLTVLWYEFLKSIPEGTDVSSSLLDELKKEVMGIAARQAVQFKTVEDLDSMLRQAGIPYVVFKGFNHAWSVYPDPLFRPCSDIDLLVSRGEWLHIIKILSENGYKIVPDPNTISHEITAHKHMTDLDIHWHIVRPGRLRVDISDYLLNQAVPRQGFTGLSDQASLLLMLFHPAITKYLNSPVSLLIHIIDLHYLTRSKNIDWDEILEKLAESGMQVSAWASLYWYRFLSGDESLNKIMEAIQPGLAKRKYLRYWIERNLAWRFWNYRPVVKLFFGLAMQETLSDTFIAIRTLMEEKSLVEIKLQSVESALVKPAQSSQVS